jgi:hypothetical protein
MKRLIILTLAMVFMATAAWAETFRFIEAPKIKTEAAKPAIERKIQVDKTKDYLEITVYPKDAKPIVYRVWPCGKIDKMVWKEVAPNEEATVSGASLTTADTILWNSGTTRIITR